MPIAITDTQRALTESIRDWAVRAEPVELVRAGEKRPTTGSEVWSQLADIGVFGIAAAEELGGAGATTADAVAALAATAEALAPGPVSGTVLAVLLLGDGELVPTLVAGAAQAAVATGPGGVVGVAADGGGLTVSGEVGLVAGAHADAHLILAARVGGEDVWFTVTPDAAGVDVESVVGLDFSQPLARIRLTGVAVPGSAVLTGVTTTRVMDWSVTVAAAEAAGIAEWCVQTAASYAKVREQFGRPIGSFQAIKQLCAEMLCRAELAAALAWDAARAADGGNPLEHTVAATAAAAATLDAAVDNAKDCIQVLGGIGFTFEHDAHLYLRRAMALRQLLGGSARWRRAAAELALTGARRSHGVDFGDDSDMAVVETERPDIRAHVRRIADLTGTDQRIAFADSGLLAPHWPPPYGLAAAPGLQLIIDAELDRAGVSRPDLVIGGWAAPTILAHGIPAQAERFVGPTLRGEIRWCQLFSEPEAGSDLASLRTKAERVDGGWRLTGQKVWTSVAHLADWGVCLARTNPDAPKHKGISYFLVEMNSPGVQIRPLREITGDVRFNEVFLTDVFVPDECVVGEVDGGWKLARTTLSNERVAMSGGATLGDRLEALIAASDRNADLDALGALVAEASACAALDLRSLLRRLSGQQPGAESSVRKLIGVRHRQAVAEAAFEQLGPDGALAIEDDDGVPYEFLLTRCLSIAGGTTQILRNLAAEQLLGLPRG